MPISTLEYPYMYTYTYACTNVFTHTSRVTFMCVSASPREQVAALPCAPKERIPALDQLILERNHLYADFTYAMHGKVRG